MINWLDGKWANWRWWADFTVNAVLAILVLGLLAFTITCIVAIN